MEEFSWTEGEGKKRMFLPKATTLISCIEKKKK